MKISSLRIGTLFVFFFELNLLEQQVNGIRITWNWSIKPTKNSRLVCSVWKFLMMECSFPTATELQKLCGNMESSLNLVQSYYERNRYL